MRAKKIIIGAAALRTDVLSGEKRVNRLINHSGTIETVPPIVYKLYNYEKNSQSTVSHGSPPK